MKGILKVAKTTIDVALELVGLFFMAGAVVGSMVTGKEGKVRFSINEHEIIDDYMGKHYPEETASAEETVEKVTEI